MKSVAITNEAVTVTRNSFSARKKVAPEYVLKVDVNENIDTKSISPKENPNPENLPAIRKAINVFFRKTVVLFLLFALTFLVSVVVGFNIVFYLFNM